MQLVFVAALSAHAGLTQADPLTIWTFDGTTDRAPPELETEARAIVASEVSLDPETAGGVYSDPAAWEAFLADAELPPTEPIDFSHEEVIAVWYDRPASCGVDIADWRVLDLGGHVHLDVQFYDSGRSCRGGQGALVAVVVPRRAHAPTWLRAVQTECR